MLQRSQEDLVQAELEADAAARRTSAILAQQPSEGTPSSAISPTPLTPSVSETMSLPSHAGRHSKARDKNGSARLSAQDLENVLEAVLKQHDMNMTAIKTELTSEEPSKGKGGATSDESSTVAELRARRDEHEACAWGFSKIRGPFGS